MTDNKQKKEVFIQKVDEKNNNYIELVREASSLNGVFYGVEVSSSKECVHYKAVFTDLKINGNEIEFTLNSFLFSKESFFGSLNDSLQVNNKPTAIPYVFTSPIKYFGYRDGDTLKMKKITVLDDSKAAEIYFVKKY